MQIDNASFQARFDTHTPELQTIDLQLQQSTFSQKVIVNKRKISPSEI